MQFKVSRDDQEYGPYTIEELTQYVSEGSLLPNDYVHNGMEWVPLSEFLKNPHKAATAIQSVSSVAKAQPQINYTKSKYNPEDSGSESNNSLRSIVGAIIVIAFLGYNFFANRNADKAVKFNNSMATLMENHMLKITSIDENDEEYFDKYASWNKKILQELEYVPFYEGKNGVGYKLKETAIEVFNRADVFIKDSVSLMNQFEKEASKVQNREKAETVLKNLENALLIIQEDFGKDIDRLMNQFEDLQKQYAKNNNLELKQN
tara:strand:- start:1255 stop:2040 length:786 start_codon:yes stop_codon:yes gene_type:complete